MISHAALCTISVVLFLTVRLVFADEEFKPPPAPPNLPELGAKIQRTMTLLATSTPQKRNRVR
ncbi:MAG: SGNH/GDSL hydrolase family protein, partial [Planctomycetes bacterium]|nr:SGNH/GDSL hydrolase family protein [Planctomycetota bacterium]